MSPRARGGQKGGRSRSSDKGDAARRNGKKGGRPRKHRYFELFEAMPNPAGIEDPLELCTWMMRANLIALHETLLGRGNPKLNSELRATTKAVTPIVPRERLKKAEDAVAAEVKKSTGKKNKPRGGSLTPAPPSSTPIRAG